MADDELKALMKELIEGQNQLLDEFQRNHPKKKDQWDKFSSISTFVSGVLIAVLGLTFTTVYAERQASYNAQQAAYNKQQAQHDNDLKFNQLRLTSIQAIGDFMQYLTSKNEAKVELALLLVSKLTNPERVGQLDIGQLGLIFQGKGAIRALTTIALIGDEREKQNAIGALAVITLYGKGEDKHLATKALGQVFAGESLYTGGPGETIKVEIISEKKPTSFDAFLDKKKLTVEGSSFTFDLGERKGQTSYLLITSRGDIGDVYKVQISGNSAVLKQIIRQTDKEVTAAFLFKIE